MIDPYNLWLMSALLSTQSSQKLNESMLNYTLQIKDFKKKIPADVYEDIQMGAIHELMT